MDAEFKIIIVYFQINIGPEKKIWIDLLYLNMSKRTKRPIIRRGLNSRLQTCTTGKSNFAATGRILDSKRSEKCIRFFFRLHMYLCYFLDRRSKIRVFWYMGF